MDDKQQIAQMFRDYRASVDQTLQETLARVEQRVSQLVSSTQATIDTVLGSGAAQIVALRAEIARLDEVKAKAERVADISRQQLAALATGSERKSWFRRLIGG